MTNQTNPRRIRRTPDYVQAARTTWRWCCTLIAGLFAINGSVLLMMLIKLDLAGLGIINFATFGLMALGAWQLRPREGHNIVPRWYVEALMELGGEEQV